MNCFASVVFPGVNPHATENVCARESMREFLCLSLQFFFFAAGLQGCAKLSQPGVYSCVSVSSPDQPTELTTELLNVNAHLCQDIHPNLSSLAHQNGLVFNFFFFRN